MDLSQHKGEIKETGIMWKTKKENTEIQNTQAERVWIAAFFLDSLLLNLWIYEHGMFCLKTSFHANYKMKGLLDIISVDLLRYRCFLVEEAQDLN